MNKLMARIVAVVLAVMMLGTVSFAATTATKDTITTDTTVAGVTVKALNADNEIIAMYQGTDCESIKIDPEKVELGETITVEYGKEGGKVTQTAVIEGKDVLEVVVVKDEIEVDGVKYTDVACASKKFVPGVGKKTKRVGFNLVSSEGSEDGLDFGKDIELSGDGEITFDVVILAVPEGVTITATPYIKY